MIGNDVISKKAVMYCTKVPKEETMCLILSGISSPNRIYPTVPIPMPNEKLNRTMHMVGQAIRYLLIHKCLRDVVFGQITSIVKKYIPNMINDDVILMYESSIKNFLPSFSISNTFTTLPIRTDRG